VNQGGRQSRGRSGVLAGVLAVLGDAGLLTGGVELLGLAVREFFLPQFETRLFPGSRPVVTITHPLDGRIPFRPDQVRSYLGFIRIWVEGLGELNRRFGRTAVPDIAESIRGLCRLYRSTGSVYRRCQTTTHRPRGPRFSPRFLLIRLFDPHLHCIPSLHVLILCYNYLHLRRVFRRRTGREDERPVAEAYQAALRVLRAVLLVKQHSLADIGPSLYVLSELFPRYDRAEADRFARDLFGGFPGVRPELRATLLHAVLADYRDMERERRRRRGIGVEDLVVEYLRAWSPRPES